MNESDRRARGRVGAVGCLFAAALLAGCPNPVTHEILERAKDREKPVVTITSPREGTYCARTVLVTGAATDASGSGGEGSVKSLHYEVLASAVSGDVTLDPDGGFAFSFPTVNLDSSFVLRLVASDWNGNTGETSITLLIQAGNDIPSFSAAAENHAAVLRWDPVPGTASYTLHYTSNGAIPSASYGTHVPGVESGVRIGGLVDGLPYVFRLQAVATSGDDNWSAPVNAIPVSPLTLCPTVRGGAGRISLEWADIPGTDEYDVLRSGDREGEYVKIMAGVRGTTYEDREIVPYEVYFYKVCPKDATDTPSAPSWGSAGDSSEDAMVVSGSCTQMFTQLATAVAVSGTKAYLSRGTTGLMGYYDSVLDIIDLSDPAHPAYLASYSLIQGIARGGRDVVVDNAMAYIAGPDPSIMTILDFEDPASPSPPNRCTGFTDIRASCIADSSHLVVADGASGLRIVDLTDPSAAFIEATISTSGSAQGVALDPARNQYVVADGSAGLTLVDRGTGERHSCATPGNAQAVAVDGSWALVACGTGGLCVVNIGNPLNPVLYTSLALPGSAVDVSISGSRAAIACGPGGVCIVDISDWYTPFVAATEYYSVNASSAVALQDMIVISDEDDTTALLKVFTVNGDRPSFGAEVTLATTDGGDLDSNGTHLFYSNASTGVALEVMDIASRQKVGEYAAEGNALPMGIIVKGNYAFLSYSGLVPTSTIEILDIEHPEAPRRLSTLIIAGTAGARFVAGDSLYIISQSGLQILDVSDPGSPTVLSKTNVSGTMFNLDVTGGIVCATTVTGEFAVVDCSTVSSPRVLGSCPVPGSLYTIARDGSYCFLGSSEGPSMSISSIDVHDLSDPMNVSSFPIPFYPFAMRMNGQYLFAVGGSYIAIIDAKHPLRMCLTDLYSHNNSTEFSTGFVIHGHHLYLSNDWGVVALEILGTP
jgi:hypothetical protein